MAAEPPQPNDDRSPQLGDAVQDVSQRISVLVREEIELAKAEVSTKASSLAQGAAVAAAAGMFVVVGLLFLIDALAWELGINVFGQVWLGFLVTAVILFVLAGLAGLLAFRAFKKGAPPTPNMAIEEAKRIRETVSPSGTAT